MSNVYEKNFLQDHKDHSPEEILGGLRKKALSTVDCIRSQGRMENNRLKAAVVILDRTDPPKSKLEIEGIDVTGISDEERQALKELAKNYASGRAKR